MVREPLCLFSHFSPCPPAILLNLKRVSHIPTCRNMSYIPTSVYCIQYIQDASAPSILSFWTRDKCGMPGLEADLPGEDWNSGLTLQWRADPRM